MRRPKNTPCHQCAPATFRQVPNFTGNATMDRVILASPNKDMANKLKNYTASPAVYGKRTGYGGGKIG